MRLNMPSEVAPVLPGVRGIDTDEYLWALAKEIEPTASQKSAAAKSHRYLRDLLMTGQFENRIQSVYLSGSYARATALRPLEDVDMIVTVDSGRWQKAWLSKYPEPEEILDSFAAAVRYRYRESSVFRQRRSIRLELYHIHIDLVPAIPFGSDGELVMVPDRNAKDWIRSGPKTHSRLASEINSQNEGRFKPLVKLLKLWNGQNAEASRLKSFFIETMAVHYFSRHEVPSLFCGLVSFFDAVASFGGHSFANHAPIGFSLSWFAPSLQDTARTGVNLFERLEDDRRKKLISSARLARDRLLASSRARTTDLCLEHVRTAFRL